MINAIAIVLFAPLFSILWSKLDKIRLNPSTPLKFGWGMLLMSLGFVAMAFTNDLTHGGLVKVSPLWLVMVFLLHTWGELCLSPIGLSMVTKLSPAKLVSTMMGIWFGSIALANYLAASLKSIVEKFDLPLFWFIAGETFIAALILMAISPILKKQMKGIV
jgi:POT family proton-dependent oligopeptide transporter